MAPTNAEILAKAHEQELEGAESAAVAQAVVDWSAAKQTAFETEIATVRQALTESQGREMTEAERTEALTALDNATGFHNGFQAVLTALVTPPSEPIPEPIPEPPVEPPTEPTPEGVRSRSRR